MIKTFVGKVEEKCSTAVKKRRKREFKLIFYGSWSKSILLQKKWSKAKIFFDYSIGTKLRPVDAIIQIEHTNLFDNVWSRHWWVKQYMVTIINSFFYKEG